MTNSKRGSSNVDARLRKHPLAPKKPRSAFIFYSQHVHNEGKVDDCDVEGLAAEKVPRVAKRLSAIWKSMTPEERKKWEDMAENDKKRYEVEKAIYVGPWTRSIEKKRYKKDDMAPKRPMSAFLDYSKTLRSFAIQTNPQVRDNKEISKILGTMWANACEKEKKPFIEKELKLRAEYNKKIAQWRSERNELIEKERKEREATVQGAINNGTSEELIKAARVAQKAAQGLPKAPPKIVCTTPTSNTIDTGNLSHDCSSLNSQESHYKQGMDNVAPHHRPHYIYHHMQNSRQIYSGNPDTPASWNVHPFPVDMPYAGVDANSAPVYHLNQQQYNSNYNAMGSLQATDHTHNNNVPGYISACDFPNNHSGNVSSFQPLPAEHMCQNNIQNDHFLALPGYNPGFFPVNTSISTHNRNQGDFSNLQPYAAQDVSSSKIDHISPNSHYTAPTPNIFNDLYKSGNVPTMQPDHFSGAANYHYHQQMCGEQAPSESTRFGARLPQTNSHFLAFPAAADATTYTNAWSNQTPNW